MAVYTQNSVKPINACCGRNVELLLVRADGEKVRAGFGGFKNEKI
jgi:hypothetical protein